MKEAEFTQDLLMIEEQKEAATVRNLNQSQPMLAAFAEKKPATLVDAETGGNPVPVMVGISEKEPREAVADHYAAEEAFGPESESPETDEMEGIADDLREQCSKYINRVLELENERDKLLGKNEELEQNNTSLQDELMELEEFRKQKVEVLLLRNKVEMVKKNLVSVEARYQKQYEDKERELLAQSEKRMGEAKKVEEEAKFAKNDAVDKLIKAKKRTEVVERAVKYIEAGRPKMHVKDILEAVERMLVDAKKIE